MKTLFTKQTVLAAALAVLMSTTAQANELINNQVSGVVVDGITQTSISQFDNLKTEMSIGAIKSERARNNTATGTVQGAVMHESSNFSPKAKETALRVGSIKSATAESNFAFGSIDGNLTQQAYDSNAKIEVGSIDAGDDAYSFAMNNRTNGFVGGDVRQYARNADAKLSVGSIGPRN